MSLLLSIQGSCSRWRMEAVGESIIQLVVHKALADAHHRVAAHLECLSRLLIRPAGARAVAIDLEEHTGIGEFASGRVAFSNQLLQDKTLFFTQFHFVL